MTQKSILDGIRVLDLGWVWAGAVSGAILAEWGAEVLKVESGTRMDPARQGRPIVGDTPDPEQNPLFHNANRRKKSVRINLQTADGADLIRRFAARCDVVIENMTPHALPALGLDYRALSEVNPRIVMVSYPLAGAGGPYSELRGYGPTAGSIVGLDNLMGYEDSDTVIGFAHPIADPVVGVHAAISILAALREREVTGVGQHIDMSMLECLLPYMGYGLLQFQFSGDRGSKRENRHPLYAPHGLYPCKDEEEGDAWIAIAVASNDEWQSLCRELGLESLLSDDRFTDAFQRQSNRRALDTTLSEATARHSRFELEQRLQAAGVAATAVLGPGDRYLDEHMRHRETFVEVEHPVLGSEPLYGDPVHFDTWRPVPMRHAPLLGEHTDEVLRGVLGLGTDEIQRLRAGGVLT
jgi:benzylsuccinate CoA-transferase BbsF subunit